jgi:hypothetical protein
MGKSRDYYYCISILEERVCTNIYMNLSSFLISHAERAAAEIHYTFTFSRIAFIASWGIPRVRAASRACTGHCTARSAYLAVTRSAGLDAVPPAS